MPARPVDGADLAEEWLNYRLMAEGATDHAPTWSWPGPERTYARHLASLPRLIRMATQQRPFTPGWDGPLGLIHAGDPRRAAAVGSLFAVAVAAAMLPGDHRRRHHHCPALPSAAGPCRRIRRAHEPPAEIAASCDDVFDLREPFYRGSWSPFRRGKRTSPWRWCRALALSLIARGDPAQAIIGAANWAGRRHHRRHGGRADRSLPEPKRFRPSGSTRSYE